MPVHYCAQGDYYLCTLNVEWREIQKKEISEIFYNWDKL
jgi:hypothetical protein